MIEVHFNNIRKYINQELTQSKTYIKIAVYWFTDELLFNTLLKKLDEGIKIELIIFNDYVNNGKTCLKFQAFIDKGGSFYFSEIDRPMHNKFCIIDGDVLINGSYNWTYFAENVNRENIIIVKGDYELNNSFSSEFDKLISYTSRVKRIEHINQHDIEKVNTSSVRDYLALDIVYKAHETGNNNFVDYAMKLVPMNITIQNIAATLVLGRKRKLKYSIGTSLFNDGFGVIVKKGQQVPLFSSFNATTSKNNQITSKSSIRYGENSKASLNYHILDLELKGLPPLPKGMAKIRYDISIDIYGKMTVVKYSVDSVSKVSRYRNIESLLEEI